MRFGCNIEKTGLLLPNLQNHVMLNKLSIKSYNVLTNDELRYRSISRVLFIFL